MKKHDHGFPDEHKEHKRIARHYVHSERKRMNELLRDFSHKAIDTDDLLEYTDGSQQENHSL